MDFLPEWGSYQMPSYAVMYAMYVLVRQDASEFQNISLYASRDAGRMSISYAYAYALCSPLQGAAAGFYSSLCPTLAANAYQTVNNIRTCQRGQTTCREHAGL